MKRAALLLSVAMSECGKILAGQGGTLQTDLRTHGSALGPLILLQCNTSQRTAKYDYTAKRTQCFLTPNLRFTDSNARHVFLANETSILISGVRSAAVHTGKASLFKVWKILYIQGVTGGMCHTSGGCSLC
jgi:hypothetical protein